MAHTTTAQAATAAHTDMTVDTMTGARSDPALDLSARITVPASSSWPGAMLTSYVRGIALFAGVLVAQIDGATRPVHAALPTGRGQSVALLNLARAAKDLSLCTVQGTMQRTRTVQG